MCAIVCWLVGSGFGFKRCVDFFGRDKDEVSLGDGGMLVGGL